MVIRLLFRLVEKEIGQRTVGRHCGSAARSAYDGTGIPRSVRSASARRSASCAGNSGKRVVNSIIYLVGLVVVVLFILSFLGLHERRCPILTAAIPQA